MIHQTKLSNIDQKLKMVAINMIAKNQNQLNYNVPVLMIVIHYQNNPGHPRDMLQQKNRIHDLSNPLQWVNTLKVRGL